MPYISQLGNICTILTAHTYTYPGVCQGLDFVQFVIFITLFITHSFTHADKPRQPFHSLCTSQTCFTLCKMLSPNSWWRLCFVNESGKTNKKHSFDIYFCVREIWLNPVQYKLKVRHREKPRTKYCKVQDYPHYLCPKLARSDKIVFAAAPSRDPPILPSPLSTLSSPVFENKIDV